MIRRKAQRESEEADKVRPKGFDDFELRLGDIMRGERATMGKSLLDVQRELRIKANYIAAIENCDPSAFDTPGFIAGYVRSYARYLGMNPDETFATFCKESGFQVAHGMSSEASVVKKSESGLPAQGPMGRDPFISPHTPFVPGRESVLNQIEPRAIGSSLVLLALIAGIGYGGWTVLKEVQQVQVAPVEQAPLVLSDLDPLDEARNREADVQTAGMTSPDADALDRLYRPQALDVPVLVARDAPISTLDPRTVGAFRAPALPEVQIAETQREPEPMPPQVLEEVAPSLVMVAVRPSWVRVTAADGSTIFEKIMESGETYEVPLTEEPPLLRAGESGAIYFATNGEHYGPVGERGVVTKNVPLSIDAVTGTYQVADLEQDDDLARMVAEARAEIESPETPVE
ncbi:4-hydroxy-3-methylbut-2-en-1-yl diphosphate synthase [Ruegeria marisrubri]|uniref:4-hydroxy-3-methylbut-2-en-1-yl diphosphate synthase n=1 Tax=Ruegeria marisrubri TaxID=1685379 RepID=A0A0X3U0C9_9RHOB|nr:helix-turn-helix domain-containing protein [Ruegeria marisrubri]KUJ80781.1 4-hydroxy-3-methylbut-2-en-1-yl diphosphate synthase [Ruegeria marisrubri]